MWSRGNDYQITEVEERTEGEKVECRLLFQMCLTEKSVHSGSGVKTPRSYSDPKVIIRPHGITGGWDNSLTVPPPTTAQKVGRNSLGLAGTVIWLDSS